MTNVVEITRDQEIYYIRTGQTVMEAAEYMTDKNIGTVPVMDSDRLVGIFSERDIMTRVVTKGLDMDSTKVEDVMTKKLVVADDNNTLEECLRKMKKAGCRHLPIISSDRLVGFISLRDLLQVDISEKEERINGLHAYIRYVPPKIAEE